MNSYIFHGFSFNKMFLDKKLTVSLTAQKQAAEVVAVNSLCVLFNSRKNICHFF